VEHGVGWTMETKIEVGLSWAQLILNMYVFDGSLIVWAELILHLLSPFSFGGHYDFLVGLKKLCAFNLNQEVYDFFF
jgi:hypothetical protein